MNFKAFAGLAAWGAIAASVSLILVFAFSVLMSSAETVEINGINVSTSAPTGIVVANGTTRLYNFTLNITSGNNISVINITLPSWPFDVNSANMSLVNTSSAPANIQLGAPVLSGWSVRFIENFTNGGIKTIQLNGSLAPQTINGTNITWFAFNATANITGSGNVSDNQTMTWKIYVSNDTHSSVMQTTTLVDNSVPNIFNVVPKLNSTRQSYLRGTSSDLFQVNVSEMNLNVSSGTNNDGSVNTTLWIKKSTVPSWLKQTLLCYNATGGFKPNGPTNNLYTCNTTLDLTNGAFLNTLTEGSIVQFFFNASDLVLNAGNNGTQDYPLNATIDRTAPASTNVLSNVSYAKNTSYVTVSARFSDGYELGNATLATNESGTWTNYTANTTSIGSSTGSYNSPLDLGVTTAYSVNFTWRNDSIISDTIVAWQILATDEAGNSHTTALQAFTVDAISPRVGVVSHTTRQNVSGTITVNVSVNDTASGVSTATLNISNSTNRAIGGLKVMNTGGNVNGYYNVTYDTAALSDGNYTIRVYANDTVDNVNDTQTVLFQADNTAPSISILGPAANANITGLFNITAEINDVIWVSYVQYKISNATSQLVPVFISMTNNSGMNMSNGGIYNATNQTTLLGDGIYNVTVWANDSVNNIAQVNVSVYIDNNAPTLINLDTTLNVANVTSPASGATYFPGRSYTFNISATDNIGVFYVIANVNGTNYTTTRYGDITGKAGNFSTTITDLAALTTGHEVQWYINDTAGNQRTTSAWLYVINKNTSAYATISANQTTVERGTFFNVTSIAFANAGILTTVNATMYANTTPGDTNLQPIITKNRLASGGTYNITSSAILPVGPINFTANITMNENYTINSTVASVIVTIVDTIAPPVVLLNASASPVYVNGTIRKTGGTIAFNVSVFENVDGWGFPNNLTVKVYANVTNGTQVFIGNLTNTSNYGYYSPNEVGGTVTIPGGLTDGNLTLNFTVVDLQGNVGFNDTSRGSNFVVSIDNTAPALSGPIPLNSSFNKGTATELFQINVTEVNLNISQNITLYWSFAPAMTPLRSKTLLCTGAGQTLYGFAGANWVCNTTLDLTQQADGESVYYFFNTSNATHPGGDLAGNAGSYGNVLIPLNSTVDRAVPSVGVLLPLGSANVSGPFTLNISANNTPGGIANVSYRITNDTFQSGMILLSRGAGIASSGYWNGTNNTVIAGLADGVYRISINATDNSGNENTTVNVTITIDNTKPNVTIVTPTTNLNYSASILMNITARDSGVAYAVASGVLKTIEYKLSNSSWSGTWLSMTNTSENGLNFDHYNATNTTSANFADGVYNITINATDYANNFNDTQYVTIHVDRNAPAVSIKSPTNGQFVKGTFNITAEVNDAVWVKSVWYRVSNGTHAVDTLGSAHLAMTNASGVNNTGGGYFNATNITSAVLFGDGSYNITVAANDTLNQVTYANVTITIDNNAPVQFGVTTNTTEPSGGTEYFPGRMYRFNKTFNDTIGTVSVIMQFNATNYTAFRYEGDTQGGNWSANVTDLAANTTGYPIIWYASDATGNWLTTTQWYYVIAKNTSAFTTISINQTTVERGDFVNITIRSTIRAEINTTIYTNYSGALASLTTFVPYPLNNQNATFTGMLKGIWNITANTTGTENYTANATLESVTFLVQDTTRPTMRVYDYTNGTAVKPGSTINLNVSIADNYGINSAFNVSVFFNGTTLGSWVFAGNISNSTFSSNASSAWANGTITIPATGMNVAGNRTINITILDSSGNLGMNDSFVINMDPGAPVWTNNATFPGSDIEYFPGRTYKFNITLADEPFGVNYVALEFNGTNYTASRIAGTIYNGNWTANITDLAANSTATGYYFRWYMNDSSGQWNTSDWLNFTIRTNTSAIARLEVNATTIERGTHMNITSYSPISALINTTIYANFSAVTLSAINLLPYTSGNQNITYVGSNLAVGSYNITANTTANANYTANSTVYMITITVQDSSPASRFITPSNNSNFSTTMSINVTVTDQGSIDMVRFNISNTTWIGTTGILNNTLNIANHYNASVNTASISDGNYNLTILANDTFGNLNSSYYFQISIDNTAPVIIFNYQVEGTRLTGLTPGNNSYRSGTISANATVSDSIAGVNSGMQLFRIGNRTNWMGPTFGLSAFAGAFNGTNGTTLLADGFYNITITANDTLGNVRTNVTFFYVDNTAPTVIALSNSTAGTYRANTTEQIRIQINDASQTNATIDVRAWVNMTTWTTIYKTTNATPSTVSIYNVTIDTSDLVDDQMVKFFVMVTDNASNVATYTGSLATPLANITINANCGNAGRTLSWCSDRSLKTSSWADLLLKPKTVIESFSSLQSNFTMDNVTKRAGIWGKFNYTYYNNGTNWLSFDPNSPPSTNSLTHINQTTTGGWNTMVFNMNATDAIFRIE